MSHLSTERLSMLCDEPPTPTEVAHLATCLECASERHAYDALRAAAAQESARIDRPLSDWNRLRPALQADGIIVAPNDTTSRSSTHRGRGIVMRRISQAAAAVLLIGGGAVAGRITAPGQAASASAKLGASASQASATGMTSAGGQYHTIVEARAAQAQFQTGYQAATAFIAQHDTTGPSVNSSAAMRTRLAALDHVSHAVGEALDEAPYDPVINGYYLTTLGQREATLRQLNTSLPVGMRITSY